MKRGARLRPVSAKRKTELTQYYKLRRVYLTMHPVCAVSEKLFGREALSTEVHHTAGRIGSNFLDVSTWMAVSRKAHRWIHDNPKEARAQGWLK